VTLKPAAFSVPVIKVASLAGFTSGEFKVTAFTSPNEEIPSFYTELFFEAVPNEYLDIDLEEWVWNEEDGMIPIIVPKYYLSLYNFGFAESQGLPQISENVINQVTFNIRLKGNGKEEKFSSSIVGFSDRLNTILVPSDFMAWANEAFGTREVQDPSRLILVSKNPADPSLFNFIEDQNFEATAGNANSGKLSAFLKLSVSAVGIIGLLITALAAWIMIVSFQLLIHKNREKIWNLFLIGYEVRVIHRFYALITIVLNSVLLVMAVLGLDIFKRAYEPYIENIGFDLNSGVSGDVWLLSVVGIVLLTVIQTLLSYRQIGGIVSGKV